MGTLGIDGDYCDNDQETLDICEAGSVTSLYLLSERHPATAMYNEWTYSSRTLRVSVMFLLVSSMSVIISFSTPHWLDSYGTQRLPNPKFTNLGMFKQRKYY